MIRILTFMMVQLTAILGLSVLASAQGVVPLSKARSIGDSPRLAIETGELRRVELVGNPLTQYPWFQYVTSFTLGQSVHIALDPALHGALPSGPVDVYVIDHRTPHEWRLDPVLIDVGGAPRVMTFAGDDLQGNTLELDAGFLTADGVGTDVARGYDIVVDIDRDGLLDAGDLLDGGTARAGLYIVPSLFDRGPLPIAEALYSGGTWLDQMVFYPTNLDELGEVPLLVISHGNGHNYQWYVHIGRHLSSWGFVVMSHSNNTGPGIISAATTTLTNTDYFLSNLDSILGGEFDDHIDASRITWLGHSRGGEGVTVAYDRLLEGSFIPSSFNASQIHLISSIAPTIFENQTTSDPHKVIYHLWTGGADSDVNGCASCAICMTFRLHERALETRLSISLHGVGHGTFHAGGGSTFAQGPCQNPRARTHKNIKTYILPLVKFIVQGQPWAEDFLWRQYEAFRSIDAPVHSCVSVDLQYRPGKSSGSRVIDDFETQPSTAVSSSIGAVTFDVAHLTENRLDDGNNSFSNSASDEMNGATSSAGGEDHRGIVFDFEDVDAIYSQGIAAHLRDFSGSRYLSFRAAQGSRHPLTLADLEDLTFSVRLVDGNGNTSTIGIGAYGGGIEEPYQRTGCGTGAGWANEFETIRIRLTDFQHDGSELDLGDITAIDFLFGPSHGSTRGRLFLDDIQLDAR